MTLLNISGRGKQSGIGLIELMIAMTIGLLLLSGLSYFLMSTSQTSRTTSDLSRMQENGRYALDILSASIRQAGYKDDPDQAFAGVYGLPALATTDGAGTAADTLTVRYAPQDSAATDCAGNTPAAGTPITETYRIAGGNLECNGVVVAAGVENMQLQLVEGTAAGLSAGYALPGAVDDNNVIAVQVSLLVAGPSASAAASAQTYEYNGSTVTASDRRLRQVYTGTSALRNRVQNAPHPLPGA